LAGSCFSREPLVLVSTFLNFFLKEPSILVQELIHFYLLMYSPKLIFPLITSTVPPIKM
jgi:hypothetical protein